MFAIWSPSTSLLPSPRWFKHWPWWAVCQHSLLLRIQESCHPQTGDGGGGVQSPASNPSGSQAEAGAGITSPGSFPGVIWYPHPLQQEGKKEKGAGSCAQPELVWQRWPFLSLLICSVCFKELRWKSEQTQKGLGFGTVGRQNRQSSTSVVRDQITGYPREQFGSNYQTSKCLDLWLSGLSSGNSASGYN